MKSKLTVLLSLLLVTVITKAQQSEWDTIEKVFGKKGTVTGNVLRSLFRVLILM